MGDGDGWTKHEWVDWLLQRKATVKPAELAKCLNVSRQAAWTVLKKMEKRGQLVKVGETRATGGYMKPKRGEVLALDQTSFWTNFEKDHPRVMHVELGRAGGALRWRKQAIAATAHIEFASFTFLDFRDVTDVSEEFLDELLCGRAGRYLGLYALINATPEIERLAHRVLHSHGWRI